MIGKYIRPLAWAWMIIVGGLLITPGGIFCIRCGGVVQASGYIGDPAVIAIAIVSIVLGIAGFATQRSSGGPVQR